MMSKCFVLPQQQSLGGLKAILGLGHLFLCLKMLDVVGYIRFPQWTQWTPYLAVSRKLLDKMVNSRSIKRHKSVYGGSEQHTYILWMPLPPSLPPFLCLSYGICNVNCWIRSSSKPPISPHQHGTTPDTLSALCKRGFEASGDPRGPPSYL